MGSHLEFSDLLADEHGTVGESLRSESVAALEHRTEALSWLDTIRGWILDFASYGDGCAEVVPLRDLADREDIAVTESDVFIHVPGQS
jgi:hypothetical protein